MKEFIKGKEVTIEFGNYDNFVDITPDSFCLESYGSTIEALITAHYSDGREIEFVHENLNDIDFESFGTTFESELNKIGYKENEVQQVRNKLYIIKEKDGTIIPFEKFTVKFDYVHPGVYGYTEEKVMNFEVRGEEQAIKFAEHYVEYPSWMQNIVVEKCK